MSVDVTAVVPAGAMSQFGMHLVKGTDLVARIVNEGGWQAFERPLPQVFFEIAKTYPGTIIDVGVNTGFYSFLGLCAHSQNTVIGFEPDPTVRQRFMDNVRLNGHLAERLRILPAGLSDRSGRMTLYIPLQDHGLIESSSSLERDFKDAHSDAVDVEVTTLDTLIRLSSPLRAPISLIKVDVEGHEKQVFVGAETTIQQMRPWIAVELLPRCDFDWFSAFLGRCRYCDLRLRASDVVVASRVEFDPDAWNHLLVPVEQYEAALSLLSRLSLFVNNSG